MKQRILHGFFVLLVATTGGCYGSTEEVKKYCESDADCLSGFRCVEETCIKDQLIDSGAADSARQSGKCGDGIVDSDEVCDDGNQKTESVSASERWD